MKVSIIGGGGLVGSCAAYALQCAGIVSGIDLLDLNADLCRGQALDLLHGSALSADQRIRSGSYELIPESDLICITAGLRRKPDESRLDLINRNVELFLNILSQVKSAGVKKEAIVLVVSNPVDVLAYLATMQLGLPSSQVLSLGTQLDSARFRGLIADSLKLPPTQVTATILGEHGDSMVPIWSAAQAAGLPLEKFPGWDSGTADALFAKTKGSGAEVIKLKGGAGFAVGVAIAEVIHAIALDRKRILPVGSLVSGVYGMKDVCISVPTVVGRKGAEQQLEIALWPKEVSALQHSATVLRETIDTVLKKNPTAAKSAIKAAPKAAPASNGKPLVTMGAGGSMGNGASSRVTISGQSGGGVVVKSLDRKLAAIHADPWGAKEFILADAKDADMAFGIGAPGLSPEKHTGELRLRTLAEYRDQIRMVAKQGIVDIVLMSASTNHALTITERLFDGSHVTPAIRANDTTDVHLARGSNYAQSAARPFRSAYLDEAMCGHLDCEPSEREIGANLGLYSVTFNNDLTRDLETLERFHEFRAEAERKGFRYFLEVFDPNMPGAVAPEKLAGYINDMIARMLAGVGPSGRPQFLKMVYHGPKAIEELFRYDPHLVVGILGGSAGTTRDAFQLLADAQKHGARVALYGRKINGAENQLAFVQFLRLIVDGVIGPVEAVKAYHAVLGRLGVRAHRPLEDDLKLTPTAMSYGGTSTSVTVPPKSPEPAAACQCHSHGKAATNGKAEVAKASKVDEFPRFSDGRPDFTKMDVAQRLAYHRARLGLGR